MEVSDTKNQGLSRFVGIDRLCQRRANGIVEPFCDHFVIEFFDIVLDTIWAYVKLDLIGARLKNR